MFVALPGSRTSPTCLPWWHVKFAPWSTGSSRQRIRSGCSTVDGNVQCDPNAMRANAEQQMRERGLWGAEPMYQDVYTLARYVSSEVGSGSPEEKVAVIEAAVNRARLWGMTVDGLLLYRQPSRMYGPIHGDAATCAARGLSTGCAPFGRWAATSQDPGVDDILIAKFVLDGGAKNFNRGADDQFGPEAGISLGFGQDWPKKRIAQLAAKRNYWVGPLPGVDHWHTMLVSSRPDIPPDSSLGQALIAQANDALSRAAPSWESVPICRKPFALPGPLVGAFAAAGALGLAYYGATVFDPSLKPKDVWRALSPRGAKRAR